MSSTLYHIRLALSVEHVVFDVAFEDRSVLVEDPRRHEASGDGIINLTCEIPRRLLAGQFPLRARDGDGGPADYDIGG